MLLGVGLGRDRLGQAALALAHVDADLLRDGGDLAVRRQPVYRRMVRIQVADHVPDGVVELVVRQKAEVLELGELARLRVARGV